MSSGKSNSATQQWYISLGTLKVFFSKGVEQKDVFTFFDLLEV